MLLEGGGDTTSSFLQSLILALVAYPEVQGKARQEIDRVIGTGRVPNINDWNDLPYIQAIVKEASMSLHVMQAICLGSSSLVDASVPPCSTTSRSSCFLI